jgi:hypothetical protein
VKLEVIQKIHDTLGGRGVDQVLHLLFMLFEIQFILVWEVKLFVTGQDKASKNSSILILNQIRPTISNLKKKIAEKCQKSVVYYLNGPL